MMVIKFAYVGEFTSRRRRVGVGEFARRRVDRIPSKRYSRSSQTLRSAPVPVSGALVIGIGHFQKYHNTLCFSLQNFV